MMYYNLLTAETQGLGSAFSPERLALAGQMTLIGMGMIFAVLAILWGILAIFKLVFSRPKKEEKISVSAPVVEEQPMEQTDEQELIAVITAAITAYRENQEPDLAPNGFRVVSFRRANGGKSWNAK